MLRTDITGEAITTVWFHLVDAGGVVNAFMLHAVINISLATISFVARSAMTTNKNRDIKTVYHLLSTYMMNIWKKYLNRPSSRTLQVAPLRHGLP